MKKKLITNLLRFGLSIGIIAWLVWNAWQDPTFQANAQKLFTDPKWHLLLAAWVISLTAVMITMVRWYLLVVALGLPFKFRDALRLGFLGYLLNFVSPGSVGGDVFKAIFIAHEHPGRRPEAVASVVLDRIIGLYGLFLVATIAIFWRGLNTFREPAPIWIIVQATLACTVIGALGICMLMIPGVTSGRVTSKLARLPKVGHIAVKLVEAIRTYSRKPWVLATNVFLSMLVHLCATVSIYLIALGVPGNVPDLLDHFLIVPLAMVAGALPGLPMGLGAIEGVLDYMYVELPRGVVVVKGQGLLVAVGYRLTTMLNALVGMVIYLSNRRQVQELIHEAEEEGLLEDDAPPANGSAGDATGAVKSSAS